MGQGHHASTAPLWPRVGMLLNLLLLALLLLVRKTAACAFSRLAEIHSITALCCETLGTEDCSTGFPATCSYGCADVLVPFWEDCGPMVSGPAGASFGFDVRALAMFAGNCRHTRSLVHFSNSECAEDGEALQARVTDIQQSCCVQHGESVCIDGAPDACDAECAVPFMTFFSSCIDHGVMGVEDLNSYRTLYKSCLHLDASELGILIGTLNSLVADETCNVDTSVIASSDALAGELPMYATDGCVDDDDALSELFEEDTTCASAAAAEMCSVVLASSSTACGCSCPNDGSGPVCSNDDEALAQAFEDNSVTCASAAIAGMCDVVIATAPAGTCGCSCGAMDGDGGGGMHLRSLQSAPAAPAQFLPAANVYFSPTCPWDTVDDQVQAVSTACCSERTPCTATADGLPQECTFECSRIFLPFMQSCRETIAALVDRQSRELLPKLDVYSHTCMNFSVASMSAAIYDTECGACGDGAVDDWLAEECDAGEANADEPDAPCRTNCTAPRCGDGIVDSGEGCDEGAMNSAEGSCGADCQPTCPIDSELHFTTLGATGTDGPTSTSGYGGTPLDGQVTLDAGIQMWTVPTTGRYRITATGAQGGDANGGNTGGLGASMSGVFALERGAQLRILVGQRGTHNSAGGHGNSPGGGGGTFVASGDGVALLVAGGGGGGRSDSKTGNGEPGVVEEAGTAGGYAGGAARHAGHDSGNSNGGFAGGGYEESAPRSPHGGHAFLDGGRGGPGEDNGGNNAGNGGFGGGGGGMYNNFQGGGGGGGYGGGGAGHDSASHGYGGGGGSYNGGNEQENHAGTNGGDGGVSISCAP